MTVIINLRELTDEIYDTLSGNVGLSVHHIALDPMRITRGEVDARKGKIVFQIDKKDVFEITVKQINPAYFEDGQP